MSSSDQYVFELQFKCKADGTDYRENQFVIIDGSSMADFSKLKEDLALCMPEPFKVQYIDDDEDIISIDTEEEFHEFAKIAKKRSARGMLMRLILNLNVSDNGQTLSRPYLSPETRHPSAGGTKSNSKNPANLESARSPSLHGSRFNMLKDIIKQELRHEILSELKEMGPPAETGVANSNNDPSVSTKDIAVTEEEMKGAEYMEDSDGNGFVLYPLEKKKTKIQKRLEKRERLVEMKIDQRLEKLEMKRKKLMERYNNQRVVSPKAVPLPRIVSAIATNESLEILKPVAVAKVFTHVWTILNDGLVSLENVELRHTWSSPGLEPLETSVKLAYLMPGQQGTVAVRFNAPKIHACSFTSYWHLFHFDNSQWREFGHYVSMTGSTKQPKATKYDFLSQVPEGKKKRKQDHHVTLMEKMEALFTDPTPKEGQEEKVLNEESTSNITLKKQMEQLQATLASSEIAAEMAREAARLLARASASAEGNTASPSKMAKPSEGDKLNNCGLDEAAAGVQQLNLLDSESDTDANMETNEDLDRGFVIVPSMLESDNQSTNMPKEVSKEDNKDIAPPTGNAGEGVQAQSTGMPFARQDPNVPYPVFPPPPRVGMVGNPLFTPQSHNLMHNNMFNYPMFPPSQNPHGIVLPPPANYPFPPVPLHIPISTPPTFVPRCMEPMPNTQYPARQTNEMFWDAGNEVRQWSSANSNETQTESPAETEAPSNTTAPAENSTVNASSAEASQPQPPSQPQPQTQLQPQPQPQPQPQTQPQQPTEAYSANNEQSRNPEPVQILPQALVDGAINVAATAYSTAWNALNNLRPKEGEASEFDPVFENNMAMLVEMGFNNLERNARLLKRFHNDISQVIGVICATGGSHNLDID